MSTSVKIALTPAQEIPIFEVIDVKKYAFGVRDERGKFTLGDFSQTTVVFDKQSIGRGVELTFEDSYIEVRLCAPSTTSDYNVFVVIVEKLVELLGANEIICEEEFFDVTRIDEVYKIAKDNLRSGLDFIISAPLQQTGPITFFGVFEEITVSPTIQRKLRSGKQAAFNELLYKSQKMPLSMI